jgi:hypothetical protein
MGLSQRRKGANGEREVAAILTDKLGFAVRRKLGQAREGGNDIDLPGWSLEIKRRARLGNLYEWLQQADQKNGSPAVLVRSDGHPWLAVVRLDDWIRLVREEIAADDLK